MSLCLCISSTHIPCHVAHRGSEVNFQEPVLTFPLVEARSPISTAVLLILGWIWSILTILLSSHSISKECWDHRCMPLYQAYKVGFRDQAQIMGLAQLALQLLKHLHGPHDSVSMLVVTSSYATAWITS